MSAKKKRTQKRTPKKDWGEAFLTSLASLGNVQAACAVAKVSRRGVYDRRDRDEEFASRWDEAILIATASLEAEAVRRARDGTLRPVFHSGKQVGKIREYSDTLLIFLLKARDPKFRDASKVTIAGDPASPVQVQSDSVITDRIDKLTAAFEGVASRASEGGADGDSSGKPVDPGIDPARDDGETG